MSDRQPKVKQCRDATGPRSTSRFRRHSNSLIDVLSTWKSEQRAGGYPNRPGNFVGLRWPVENEFGAVGIDLEIVRLRRKRFNRSRGTSGFCFLCSVSVGCERDRQNLNFLQRAPSSLQSGSIMNG